MCKMPLSYFQGQLQNYQILSPATFCPLHCVYIDWYGVMSGSR